MLAGGQRDGGPAGQLAGEVVGGESDDAVGGLDEADFGGSEFDGFLDDPVELLFADEGDGEDASGGGRGDGADGLDVEVDVFLAGGADGCVGDAACAVEEFDGGAEGDAHDGGEVAGFGVVEGDGRGEVGGGPVRGGKIGAEGHRERVEKVKS